MLYLVTLDSKGSLRSKREEGLANDAWPTENRIRIAFGMRSELTNQSVYTKFITLSILGYKSTQLTARQ
jgi:hypothetical protein